MLQSSKSRVKVSICALLVHKPAVEYQTKSPFSPFGRHIQSLNKQWRSEDKPTDVLSFPQEWIEGIPEVLLGDVVISLETAAKQAKERNYALLDELRVLLVG